MKHVTSGCATVRLVFGAKRLVLKAAAGKIKGLPEILP